MTGTCPRQARLRSQELDPHGIRGGTHAELHRVERVGFGYEYIGFGKQAGFGWLSDDLSTNGTIGDPTGATPEFGKQLFEANARNCAAALAEIAWFTPS